MMKSKLTLFAAVILAGIGSTAAIASLDADKPADKPAAMSCCAVVKKAPATTADKDAPATTSMSCHANGQTAKESTTAKSKGCCK